MDTFSRTFKAFEGPVATLRYAQKIGSGRESIPSESRGRKKGGEICEKTGFKSVVEKCGMDDETP